jgi:hypothetical protein
MLTTHFLGVLASHWLTSHLLGVLTSYLLRLTTHLLRMLASHLLGVLTSHLLTSHLLVLASGLGQTVLCLLKLLTTHLGMLSSHLGMLSPHLGMLTVCLIGNSSGWDVTIVRISWWHDALVKHLLDFLLSLLLKFFVLILCVVPSRRVHGVPAGITENSSFMSMIGLQMEGEREINREGDGLREKEKDSTRVR